jgi:hypothetical protein
MVGVTPGWCVETRCGALSSTWRCCNIVTDRADDHLEFVRIGFLRDFGVEDKAWARGPSVYIRTGECSR